MGVQVEAKQSIRIARKTSPFRVGMDIEDLQVRNMSKSAASTSEAPGRNVKAKSGLNKAILDQGWLEFRRQLQYKLDWSGGMLIAVPS